MRMPIDDGASELAAWLPVTWFEKVGRWWAERVPTWVKLLAFLVLLYLAIVNSGGMSCRGC